MTSVIDLISPLESNEEGDHHSVTVTTRWDMKSYFAKSQCEEIKASSKNLKGKWGMQRPHLLWEEKYDGELSEG